MIGELVARGETVYPLQLGELLSEANALADAQGTGPGDSCSRSAELHLADRCGFIRFGATSRLDQ